MGFSILLVPRREEGPLEAGKGPGERPAAKFSSLTNFLVTPLLQKGLALDTTLYFSKLVTAVLEQKLCNKEKSTNNPSEAGEKQDHEH